MSSMKRLKDVFANDVEGILSATGIGVDDLVLIEHKTDSGDTVTHIRGPRNIRRAAAEAVAGHWATWRRAPDFDELSSPFAGRRLRIIFGR